MDARSAIPFSSLAHLNALVPPGQVHQFEPFTKQFCLTDIVLDLWSFPESLASKASCGIWLITPAESRSEILFQCFVDKYGHQIHLESAIACPAGTCLTANAGIFAEGQTADLRVLMSGYYS
jgi:hypothetical protein